MHINLFELIENYLTPTTIIALCILLYILSIILGVWVYLDAKRRRVELPALWSIATIFSFSVFFAYLIIKCFEDDRGQGKIIQE